MRLNEAGRLRIRTRWGWASARPRNEYGNVALLQARRSNPRLLAIAALQLIDRGFEEVVSSPVPDGQVDKWTSAGFEPYAAFDIMRASLNETVAIPDLEISVLTDRNQALAIDRSAFDPEWRYSQAGLEDSIEATSSSELLGHPSEGDGGNSLGYAVVGRAGPQGFLQRIAVDPNFQDRGIGRSLVRAAKQWARNRGASIMVLNTREDNDGAHHLYRSEGFSTGGQLHVLRFTPPS